MLDDRPSQARKGHGDDDAAAEPRAWPPCDEAEALRKGGMALTKPRPMARRVRQVARAMKTSEVIAPFTISATRTIDQQR